MGENVNPFSFKRDIFGQVEGPKYAIDKILSFTLYYGKCPSCNFNNRFENLEVCPFCGQNLVVIKEENNEAVN